MIVSTDVRRDQNLTIRVAVTATKWARPAIATKVAVMLVRKVVAMMTIHAGAAKMATAVGDPMVHRTAMQKTTGPAACGLTDRHAAMVHPAMLAMAIILTDQTVRPLVMDHHRQMAITAIMVPDLMGTTTRAPAAIKKGAAISPKLPFRFLSLAPGPVSLWSQPTRDRVAFAYHAPIAIVMIAPILPAD